MIARPSELLSKAVSANASTSYHDKLSDALALVDSVAAKMKKDKVM